jgi:probable rRNA maturation factor
LCVPVLEEQAKEHKHSLCKESVILFIHGVLHLLGYDHETDADYAVMQPLEDILLHNIQKHVEF